MIVCTLGGCVGSENPPPSLQTSGGEGCLSSHASSAARPMGLDAGQAEDFGLSGWNDGWEARAVAGGLDAAFGRAEPRAEGVQAPKAPLDLIEDHLTEDPYVEASRGLPESLDLQGWKRPNQPGWSASECGNMVLKVQRFASGGYEATTRRVDLHGLARMMDAPRHRGKREAPAEVNSDVQKKNAARAKRAVRLACKNVGVDRLMTLTRRESDPSEFWSRDAWAKGWDKFVRLCKRAGLELVYVAVLEQHKKGNFHLHVALTGHAPVNLLRQIWWACCGGRGMGNVDIKRRRTNDRMHRTAKIASYISKYIAKQFEDSEFNKKRYWASRQSLPDVRRVILRAENLNESLAEVADYLGLDLFKLMQSKYCFFAFPSGEGFWLSYHDDIAQPPPF